MDQNDLSWEPKQNVRFYFRQSRILYKHCFGSDLVNNHWGDRCLICVNTPQLGFGLQQSWPQWQGAIWRTPALQAISVTAISVTLSCSVSVLRSESRIDEFGGWSYQCYSRLCSDHQNKFDQCSIRGAFACSRWCDYWQADFTDASGSAKDKLCKVAKAPIRLQDVKPVKRYSVIKTLGKF